MRQYILFSLISVAVAALYFGLVPKSSKRVHVDDIQPKGSATDESKPSNLAFNDSAAAILRARAINVASSQSEQLAALEFTRGVPWVLHANMGIDRSSELRLVGDTAKFLDYTVVRSPLSFRNDNPDVVALTSDWKRDSEIFFIEELGMNNGAQVALETLDRAAFGDYTQKSEFIVEQAQRIFGADVSIVLEGALKAEFNQAHEQYEHSLKTWLGEDGYQRFSDYRNRYRKAVVSTLGWLPGSVIR